MYRALESERNDVGLSLPRLALRRARQGAERSLGRRSRTRKHRHVIFAFAVRRLKWLARIPGAPQIFDAMLFAATGLFYPKRLRAISKIEAAVGQCPGMRVGIHRLGGVGVFFRGKESSHVRVK